MTVKSFRAFSFKVRYLIYVLFIFVFVIICFIAWGFYYEDSGITWMVSSCLILNFPPNLISFTWSLLTCLPLSFCFVSLCAFVFPELSQCEFDSCVSVGLCLLFSGCCFSFSPLVFALPAASTLGSKTFPWVSGTDLVQSNWALTWPPQINLLKRFT